MNTQPSCLSVNADTIESFPVESPVSYDDIQDETITPMDRRSMDPNVSDAVLNCDCRVSVCCDSRFRITSIHFSFTGGRRVHIL